MKYIGVDIGGMTIKAGVVLDDGSILCKKVANTHPNKADVEIVKDIANLVLAIIEENGLSVDEIAGVGIGSPLTIAS